jgi:micrococcal nuclease
MSRHPHCGVRMSLLLSPILVAVVVTTSCGQPVEPSPDADGRITRVIDGDTVDVEFVVDGRAVTDRVRLIGIDTPETKKPDTPVECFGPEASARTAQLLPEGTEVRVVLDVEERDDYGRILAYVYRVADDVFVNRQLLADGMARVLPIRPNVSLATELQAAEAEARRALRGLWGACPLG